ncbi:MAG: tetratricopeptide repeat protein [Fervidicoccaceae archaeon]
MSEDRWVSVDGREAKLLSILSDDIMIKILVILSSSPSSTRGLSRILGVGESSISRRIKRLEALGLVEGRWVSSGGINVKLYSLRSGEITIRIGSQGIFVSFGKGGQQVYDLNYSIPNNRVFVGRRPQLEFLRRGEGLTFIVGVAGIGKTSLAAQYAGSFEGPVLWNRIGEGTTFPQLIRRISLFFAALGDRRILDLLDKGFEDPDGLADLLLDLLRRTRVLIVIDDYHNNHDRRIEDLVRRLATTKISSRIIVISRKKPGFYVDRENMLILSGMGREEAYELASIFGIGYEDFERAYIVFGGVPQLLILYFNGVKRGLAIRDVFEDISEYIAREMLGRMSYEERLVLEMLSILRRPAPYQLLKRLGIRGPDLRDAVSSLERSMLIERTGNQYSVNESLGRVIERNIEDPEGMHEIAANFYGSSRWEEDIVEAIYHYIMSNRVEDAAKLVPKILEPMSQARISLKSLEKTLAMAVERYGDRISPTMGWIYLALGMVKKLEGSFKEALDYLDRSDSMGMASGDQRLTIYSKIEKSIVLRQIGEYGASKNELRKALAMSRGSRDRYIVERILYNLAVVNFFTGDLDSSEKYFRDILARVSRSGDRFREALTLGWLGMIYRLRLMAKESLKALERSSEIFSNLGARHSLAIAYREMASTYFIAGDLGKALDSLGRALSVLDQESYPHLAAGIYLDIAVYRALRGELENARRDLQNAIGIMTSRGIEDPEYRAIQHTCTAIIQYAVDKDFQEEAVNALRLADRCGIYRKIFVKTLIGGIMVTSGRYREKGEEILGDVENMLRSLGGKEYSIKEFLENQLRERVRITRTRNSYPTSSQS